LILASGSSSRRALLVAAGLNFTARPANIDEAKVKRDSREAGADAAATALRLAELKAQAVSKDHPEAIVIGADQLLVCEDRWFDKPAEVAAAGEQLRFLRGRAHQLITAVACYQRDQHLWHHVAAPRLVMRDFSDSFLASYLAFEQDAVTTSVGAYRLEGLGMHLFDAIDGEHAAILGLPMLALLSFLRQHSILIY
jgi:septum formation protein